MCAVRTRSQRLWSCILVTGVVTLGMMHSPQRAWAVPDQLIKTVQLNICGNICFSGNTSNAANEIAFHVNTHGAQIVTLNEVCQSQLNGAAANTGQYAWYFETSGSYSRDGRGQSTCVGSHFGIGSLSSNSYVGPRKSRNSIHK